MKMLASEKIVSKFRSIGDALGLGIDEGIIVSVAYLNELGFHTSASCEGHVNDRGLPHAWVDFMGPYQSKVYHDQWSILNRITNSVRNKVNKIESKIKDEEKFKEKYGSWTTLYYKLLEEHRLYDQYKKEVGKFKKEFPKLKSSINSLVKEFYRKKKIRRGSVFLWRLGDGVRLDFCSKTDHKKINNIFYSQAKTKRSILRESRKKYKSKSDKLAEKFEEFLIEKFNDARQ